MMQNRKTCVILLLAVYLGLAVLSCIILPRRFSARESDDAAATVSAPLDLPENIQERLKQSVPEETPQAPVEAPSPAVTDSEEKDAEPADDTAKKPKKRKAHISTREEGSSVHVRAAAGKDSEILTKLRDGDAVTVLSVSGKWYEVKKGKVTGYVYGDYLVYDK